MTNAFLENGSPAATPAKAAPKPAPAPKPGPNTASGVPHPVGKWGKQLDGTQATRHSAPVPRGGLGERQPAPTRVGDSGFERAAAKLADKMHPRTAPKSTRR